MNIRDELEEINKNWFSYSPGKRLIKALELSIMALKGYKDQENVLIGIMIEHLSEDVAKDMIKLLNETKRVA